MTCLPIKVLFHVGFQVVQQKGNHVFYRHHDGKTTTVPNHPGRNLARPLREIEMTPEEFIETLTKI